MYINFWYAAERSDNLRDKPLRVRMLGQDFVLFRDAAGQARCLSNTCVHRGGSLGGGRLHDGQVMCPYHGWRFAGDGRCTRIPSLGKDAPVPGRVRVDSYPVIERYGLVFCFLGDLPEAERPGILEIREWDAPGFRFYTFITPVDESRVRRFLVHARNVQLGEKMDRYILETNGRAEEEDRLVVADLEPRLSPDDTTREFLVEDDAIMARYRERLRDWERRGWKIDLDRVRAGARSTAWAIPSPARRMHKGWVLEPVPLVAAGTVPAAAREASR
jgi:phenylpropionate dioxygenase-like ring-hydroxylating dioxygenase large terminal subunit